MISLNLISTNKKKELSLTQAYLVIKNIIIMVLFFSSILAIVLLLTKFVLQRHFEQIVNQTTLTTQYANTFGSEVREFNKLIVAVDGIQKNYHNWTDFFVVLSKLTPAEITIDSLNIVEGNMLIKGTSLTRNKLLEFEKILKGNELFSNTEIPIDDLLKKYNIKFNLRSDINLNNF